MLKNFCLCSGQYCDIVKTSTCSSSQNKRLNKKHSMQKNSLLDNSTNRNNSHSNKCKSNQAFTANINSTNKTYIQNLINNKFLKLKSQNLFLVSNQKSSDISPNYRHSTKNLRPKTIHKKDEGASHRIHLLPFSYSKASKLIQPYENDESYDEYNQTSSEQENTSSDDHTNRLKPCSFFTSAENAKYGYGYSPNFTASTITSLTTTTTNSIHFYHPKSIQNVNLNKNEQKEAGRTVVGDSLKPSLPSSQPPTLTLTSYQKNLIDFIRQNVSASSSANNPSPATTNAYESIYCATNTNQINKTNLVTEENDYVELNKCFNNSTSRSSNNNNNKTLSDSTFNKIFDYELVNESEPIVNIVETSNMSGQEIFYLPPSETNSRICTPQIALQQQQQQPKSLLKMSRRNSKAQQSSRANSRRGKLSSGGSNNFVSTNPSQTAENKSLDNLSGQFPKDKKQAEFRAEANGHCAVNKQQDSIVEQAQTNTSNLTQTKTVTTSIVGSDMTQNNVELEKLINRLECVTNRLEQCARNGPNTTDSANGAKSSTPALLIEQEELPVSVLAFDDLENGAFSQFRSLSAKLDGDVKTIFNLVEKVFKAQRGFLLEAVNSTQPSQSELNKFFQEFSQTIQEVQNFREKNRKSELFNHLSALSESIGAFGWIAVSPAPSPYIKEMSDAAQFYTNRVLKDYKEKDANHVNWAKQWLQFLSELQAFVKQHHTTGVSWNSTRKGNKFDALRATKSSSTQRQSGHATASAAAVSGAPPPPPPPPAMPNFKELLGDESSNKTRSGPSNEALFAELNRGADITKNLKQVRDDQKTHKNPNLRAGALVPSRETSATSVASKTSTQSLVNKPPVLELVDKKWKVEYQTNRHDLVIDETDLKQTVYIYQCKDCTVTVKGKVNSILLDSCTKVGLLFDDVLSTIEFINCRSVQMQVMGKVPTVSIEKTDGCQVYLSKQSLQTEIVSSKSSSMNVLVPDENNDFTELPVPEQFKTIVQPGVKKLSTNPTEIC